MSRHNLPRYSDGTLRSVSFSGAYPIVYSPDRDGLDAQLCPDCANRREQTAAAASLLLALGFDVNGDPDTLDDWQWEWAREVDWSAPDEAPAYAYAHEEGPPVECADCPVEIHSAYGDPDALLTVSASADGKWAWTSHGDCYGLPAVRILARAVVRALTDGPGPAETFREKLGPYLVGINWSEEYVSVGCNKFAFEECIRFARSIGIDITGDEHVS